MGGARGTAPGLGEGGQELLLLAQGVGDEEGQGAEARGQVFQLGLQAADLLLQVLAPIVELCDQVVHDVLHLYGQTDTAGHRRARNRKSETRGARPHQRVRAGPPGEGLEVQAGTCNCSGGRGPATTHQETCVMGRKAGESRPVLMSLLTRALGSEAAQDSASKRRHRPQFKYESGPWFPYKIGVSNNHTWSWHYCFRAVFSTAARRDGGRRDSSLAWFTATRSCPMGLGSRPLLTAWSSRRAAVPSGTSPQGQSTPRAPMGR